MIKSRMALSRILNKKREPTMPRLNLKVVGNHESRCNDSDPRICVRTTMLILVLDKFPTFTITRLSITLLIFSKCRGPAYANPIANLAIFYNCQTVLN